MSEGLSKLTEYLNQTRRQAELAIDTLSQRVHELELENKELKRGVSDLQQEKTELNQCISQLRLETSKKWRLQERDDWKCLVDSMQRDRDRLHDECMRLDSELLISKSQVQRLNEEVEYLSQLLEQHQNHEHFSAAPSGSPSVSNSATLVSSNGILTPQQSPSKPTSASSSGGGGLGGGIGGGSGFATPTSTPLAANESDQLQSSRHFAVSESPSFSSSSSSSALRPRGRTMSTSSENVATDETILNLTLENSRLKSELEKVTAQVRFVIIGDLFK